MFCHPKMYFLSPHLSTSEVGVHLSIDGKQSTVMLFNWQWFFLVIHKITVCFRMMSYIWWNMEFLLLSFIVHFSCFPYIVLLFLLTTLIVLLAHLHKYYSLHFNLENSQGRTFRSDCCYMFCDTVFSVIFFKCSVIIVSVFLLSM